jgi:ABC-type glycerol-3-phosphate transport system permease component
MTLTATPPRQTGTVQRRTLSASQTSVERVRKTSAYILLVAGSAVFIIPFLWMLTTSLKTTQEVLAYPPKLLPGTPHFENYPDAWTSLPFTTFLVNSIIISGLSVIGNLISCVLPAYAFARLRARFRGPMFALMVATMAIPAEVTLVPTFIMFSKLNLVNTYWPLFLPAWFGYAFFIFLLRQFFLSIPQELSDAASIDGAGHLRILWSIFLPMSRPAIAAVAIFSFVGNWNNFLTPLIYLRTQNNFTLALGLSLFKGQYETQYNQMMAVGIISLLPILIVFFLAQRTFFEGVRLSGLGGR